MPRQTDRDDWPIWIKSQRVHHSRQVLNRNIYCSANMSFFKLERLSYVEDLKAGAISDLFLK